MKMYHSFGDLEVELDFDTKIYGGEIFIDSLQCPQWHLLSPHQKQELWDLAFQFAEQEIIDTRADWAEREYQTKRDRRLGI